MAAPKNVPSCSLGESSVTGRGFEIVTFVDTHGQECSLQESSAVPCEDDERGPLWLGVDDADPKVMKSEAKALGLKLPPGEVSGYMPYPIPDQVLLSTRMHLDETRVRGLIDRLQTWLDTGCFSSEESD